MVTFLESSIASLARWMCASGLIKPVQCDGFKTGGGGIELAHDCTRPPVGLPNDITRLLSAPRICNGGLNISATLTRITSHESTILLTSHPSPVSKADFENVAFLLILPYQCSPPTSRGSLLDTELVLICSVKINHSVIPSGLRHCLLEAFQRA